MTHLLIINTYFKCLFYVRLIKSHSGLRMERAVQGVSLLRDSMQNEEIRRKIKTIDISQN